MIHYAEAPNDAPSDPPSLLGQVAKIFAEDGWLQQAMELEHRPEQAAMAHAVAASLCRGGPLLCEAGTGVGKSLAYLIPGILHAISAKRPLVVSSHTIALQQQIEKHDLSICRELFARIPVLEQYKKFNYSLLVGRGNYLCGHRLARAIETRTDLFGNSESEELERIVEWARLTESGMREELRPAVSAEVWEWVNADSSSCNRKNCDHETCFYRKALARRSQADVIIVNHSLLFSLLAAGLSPEGDAPGVLFANDCLVLDEAHTVPDTATDHFGISVSSYAVTRTLKRLYQVKAGKARGMLAKIGRREDQTAVLKASVEAETFFNEVAARYLRQRPLARLHEPNWIGGYLMRPLGEVIRRLRVLSEDKEHAQLRDELRDQAERLQLYSSAIVACIELKDTASEVYWVEKGGRQGSITTLRSAPIDVAPALRAALFEKNTSVTLTSATLTTAGRMEPFQARAGAETARTCVEASPFDYEHNMQIFIATDMPAPSRQEGRLDIDYLAEMICFNALRIRGGTLALFTSYADLAAVARQIEPALRKAGRPLLAQGSELSRSELKADFIAAGDALLLGTDSFWTGFDVPGPALAQVIMARLPFDNPGDPVREARGEAVRARGGSPFAEISLPEAVIRFRQGVGRLIRNQSDQGRLVLLDSRLLNKPYGRWFLESLPKRSFARFNRADRERIIPQEVATRRGRQ